MNPTFLIILGTYGSIALLYFLSRHIRKRKHDRFLKEMEERQRFLEKQKPLMKTKLDDLEKEPLPEEEEISEEEELEEALTECQIQNEDEFGE